MRHAAVKNRKQKPAHSKPYRFDARLNEELKMLIQKAPDLEGCTITDFVVRSAQVAAERTLQERAILTLSARETESFVEALLSPAEPSPVLRAAAQQYKKHAGRWFEYRGTVLFS